MPVLTELPVRDIGGKAKQLVELQLAGFRVPDFLCSPPDIPKAFEILGAPLAVRSSASTEDGRELSFAGQFRSFLNLWTVEAVEAARAEVGEDILAVGNGRVR